MLVRFLTSKLFLAPDDIPGDGGGDDGDVGNPSSTPAAPTVSAADLAAANERAENAERASAREKALRLYPTLSEEVLESVNGSPDDILSYAEKLHNHIESRSEPQGSVPAPAAGGVATPTPMPGVGAAPIAGDQTEARIDELTQKVFDKTATRGARGSEANELVGLSLTQGFKEIAAGGRR